MDLRGAIFGISLLASAAIGCTSVFLQNDGFGKELESGCGTEAECADLVRRAEVRRQKCEPNTVGKVRCDEAQHDLDEAHALYQKLVAEPERATRDPEVARRVQSCRTGQAEACAQASESRTLPDESRQQLLAEAHDLWWEACEKGDNDACIQGAERSRGEQQSRYLMRAGQQGDGRGYWFLAQGSSGAARAGLLRKACELEHPDACKAVEIQEHERKTLEEKSEAIASEEIASGRCRQQTVDYLRGHATQFRSLFSYPEFKVQPEKFVVLDGKNTYTLDPTIFRSRSVAVAVVSFPMPSSIKAFDSDGYASNRGSGMVQTAVKYLPKGLYGDHRVIDIPPESSPTFEITGRGCAMLLMIEKVGESFP